MKELGPYLSHKIPLTPVTLLSISIPIRNLEEQVRSMTVPITFSLPKRFPLDRNYEEMKKYERLYLTFQLKISSFLSLRHCSNFKRSPLSLLLGSSCPFFGVSNFLHLKPKGGRMRKGKSEIWRVLGHHVSKLDTETIYPS